MYWFFVNYRRDDASIPAQVIKKALIERFGQEAIYFDVEAPLLGGDDYEKPILEDVIPNCKALLVIVGPQWLSDQYRQRLHDPADLVRREIEAARQHGKEVILILVGRATKQPSADQLPESLKFLGGKTNFEQIKGEKDLDAEVEFLVQRLERQFGKPSRPLAELRLPAADDFRQHLLVRRRGPGGDKWEFQGRQWLWDEIERWRCDPHGRRALLILGGPGVGKSAIVGEMVQNPRNALHPHVLAWHCCQHNEERTRQPGWMVGNLAAQLAERLPAYAEALNRDAKAAEALAGRETDPLRAIRDGIAVPLASLPPPAETQLLICDALDEAIAPGAVQQPLSIIQVLSAMIPHLPAWLRVVATSRDEPEVTAKLAGLKPFYELPAQQPENLDDVRQFVRQRLEHPELAKALANSSFTSEQVTRRLTEKSQGKFLYVVYALEAVAQHSLTLEELDRMPGGMEGFYQASFERLFPHGDNYNDVRRLLELMVAAEEPLSRDQIARASALPRAAIHGSLTRLRQFLRRRADGSGGEGREELDHKSLADWLTSDDNATYWVDPRSGHQSLAAMCEEEFQRGQASLYCLRYWPAHLVGAVCWDKLAALLTDWRFLEAKASSPTHLVFDLINDFTTAMGRFPAAHPQRRDLETLQQFIRSQAHVLARWPELFFQQAYNEPAEGLISREAQRRAAAGQCPTRWLEWLNRPRDWSPPACLQTLVGHSGHVNGLKLLPDGRRAVAWSWDGTLRVWDLEAGNCTAVLEGHTNSVNGMKLLPDGRRAISWSWDGTLRVWDLEAGNCTAVLEGHTNSVNGMKLLPDGRRAISWSWDGTLRVWDLDADSCTAVLEGHTGGVDGMELLPDGRRAVSWSWDGTLRVWDLEAGNCTAVLEGHTGGVDGMEILPDGRRAVSRSWDGTLRVWDLEAGNYTVVLEGHTDGVNGVELLPDGRRAVSWSADGTLRVWDLEAGNCTAVLEGHTESVNGVELLPDGRRAVSWSRDGTLRVWDLEAGNCTAVLEGHTSWVNGVELLPDGRRAVSWSDDGTLRVWDLEAGNCTAVLEGHTDGVNGMELLPDGRRAVSWSFDGSLRVWDLEAGNCTAVLEGHTDGVNGMELLPDGRRAVSWSRDGTLRVWDLEAGNCTAVLEGHTGGVKGMELLPDGRRAVSWSDDGTLRVWDLEAGNCTAVLEGHTDGVKGMELLPDGRRVVSWSRDGTLRVWDLEAGNCTAVLEGHTDGVKGMELLPDGRRAVSWSRDGTLRVWDLEAGNCTAVLEGHTDDVWGMELLPDGRRAVSWSSDRTLRVWGLEAGNCTAVLEGHTGSVYGVKLLPDGRRAVSWSGDLTLRVWDLEAGNCTAVLDGHTNYVDGVVLLPDGRHAVSWSWDGTLRVWELERYVCLNTYAVDSDDACRCRIAARSPSGCHADKTTSVVLGRVRNTNSGQSMTEAVELIARFPEACSHAVCTADGRRVIASPGTRRVYILALRDSASVGVKS